jgi:glycosyltransferase involved in cell wall biosynthesis
LVAIILTKNEERNLPACLASLAPLSAPVIVVDSGSTDRTREIALSFDCTVVEHTFRSHAAQWKWAVDHAPLRATWILGLDADQRLTGEAAAAIKAFISSNRDERGAYLCRRQVFRGRWIRHGGYYPKYLLKLFRRDAVLIDENQLVDHHFAVDGNTLILDGDLIEANANEDEIRVWIEKHNRYARLQAEEEWRGSRNGSGRLFGNPDERTAWLKSKWRRLPLFIRPSLYFLYRYFLRLGFLDGKEGFIFHFLQGYWYRLLVDINIDEMRRHRVP